MKIEVVVIAFKWIREVYVIAHLKIVLISLWFISGRNLNFFALRNFIDSTQLKIYDLIPLVLWRIRMLEDVAGIQTSP